MSVVETKKLTKAYGTHKALDDFSVTIQENTITGLIGRNGAGKTTLLKILSGFWRGTSGGVKVFDKNPFNDLTVATNSIFIDDRLSFPTSITIGDILQEANRFYPNWDIRLAERLFDYFSFHPDATHNSLSKGKKSTFNMIIGLASHCPLTMFDEPTTGMDAAVRKDFYRALLKDYIAHPRTIILSSHHLEEVEDLLEDVLLIKDGKKHLHVSIDELKEYAVGLTGKSALVEQWVHDKEVLYSERIGPDNSYIVIKNNVETTKAARLGIEVSSVSSSDVCVYLTNKTTGGIDDVFNTPSSI
ncbi:MAG TPA: ABC transporter ATP-binding protein [Bacillota bacterium]|nr:ABC transporter ATP-binding protein [Bacillota bacterium]